jgi:succinate-acetate transporter protein
MENNFETKSKPNVVKAFFRSWDFWKPFLGVALGSLGGFLLYYFDGNSSGTNGITSSLSMSMFYGGLFGLFIVKSPCSSGRC